MTQKWWDEDTWAELLVYCDDDSHASKRAKIRAFKVRLTEVIDGEDSPGILRENRPLMTNTKPGADALAANWFRLTRDEQDDFERIQPDLVPRLKATTTERVPGGPRTDGSWPERQWRFSCPLCPREVLASDRKLFAAAEKLVTAGVSEVSLRALASTVLPST